MYSCGEDSTTLFTPVSSSSSNIQFKNLLRESEEFNVLTFGYFYNGGGVAVGDINNDGLDDIYFTGNMMASHLYLNQGGLEFKEIATDAGVKAEGLWNTGVTMVDINADGWLDIYVCRSAAALGIRRKNLLFINNKNLTFTESAASYGLDDQGYSTQAAFLDYDRDGDLDMFLLNHSVQKYAGFGRNLPQLKNQKNKDYGDRLYQNNLFEGGDGMIGRFWDVTDKVGINSTVLGFGLGVAVDDLNGDGWLDIYVSNDYNEEDYLYINQQDGTFKNEVLTMLDQSSLFSMGNDIADINNDGLPDIISLDMLPETHERIQMTSGSDNYAKKQQLYESGFHLQSMRNMLHLNNGDGTFSELGQLAGISNTDWSWASLIEDFDLDGHKDILITNGYKADYTNMDFMSFAADQQIKSQTQNKTLAVSDLISEIPSIHVANKVFKNMGNVQFEDVTKEWGLDQPALSNGAAYADLDNDGDLDLLLNHVNQTASLYRNNTVERGASKAITVTLKGHKNNPLGIGARLTLKDDADNILTAKTVNTTRGFQSAVPPKMYIADTLFNQAKSVDVLWSNGVTQTLNIDGMNGQFSISYDSIHPVDPIASSSSSFDQLSIDDLFDYTHQQVVYNDFDRQKLMPFKMSDRGPKAISADVNGDGLLDVYLCGAAGYSGKLFIQKRNNSFVEIAQPSFKSSRASDEMDAIFFDADGDQDLDLYVACSAYQEETMPGNKLYLNDGRGQYTLLKQVQIVDGSYSTVVAGDVDGDGDEDLFIGGFMDGPSFPTSTSSKCLINDGTGQFTDQSADRFAKVIVDQIVTDALMDDFDKDGDMDLAIVGHWMPVTICYNTSGQLDCKAIENSSGLWNVIKTTDRNQDDYPDFIVGNYGLNSQLSSISELPLKLYYEDFDQNGTIDPVVAKTVDGTEYPFAFRDDLIGQLPFLKKQVPSYSDYAQADMNSLFTDYELDNVIQKRVDVLASVVLLNRKNGSFQMESLPWQAQQSPIYALEVADVNQDGYQDVLLGGNQVGAMVQLGPNLANKGTLLLGTGDSRFRTDGVGSSSLGVQGEVRDIIAIGDDRFLMTRNRDSLIILKTKTIH